MFEAVSGVRWGEYEGYGEQIIMGHKENMKVGTEAYAKFAKILMTRTDVDLK